MTLPRTDVGPLIAATEKNRDLNAFIHFDATAVKKATGFPVAVKDNIVTRDAPTTCGSRILGEFHSPFDATVVRRLRDAGGFVFGKTNLDEFAMGSSTEHSAFGPTRNPWDRTRVAGGSSGGSAAAVAARLVPAGLGSETGGSVRQPAAFCGVIGLKPTYGRVSRSGLVAFASSLDQIGVFSVRARVAAEVLRSIAGQDDADSTSSSHPVEDYLAQLDRGIEGLRFGVIAEAIDQLSGEVRQNFDAALDLIRKNGGVVERISIPTIKYAIAIYYIVANAEASANLARFDGIRYGHRTARKGNLKATYFASRSEGFGSEVKRRIMLGTFALSAGYYEAYYGRAQKIRALMRDQFDQAFRKVHCLLTPTTPAPAFRIGEKSDDPLAMYLSDIFTAPANLVGIPAIAIPSGFSRERLPLSLQAMAPRFEEGQLLRLAQFFESVTDSSQQIPTEVH